MLGEPCAKATIAPSAINAACALSGPDHPLNSPLNGARHLNLAINFSYC